MHSSNTVVPKSTTPRMLESECHHQASAGGERALHVDLAHTNSTYAQTTNHEVVNLQRSATSVRPANNPSLLKVCEAIQSSPWTRNGPRVLDLNNPTGLLRAIMRRCDLHRAPSTKQ